MWLEKDWSSWLRYWRALAMLSWSVVYLLLLTLYDDRRFGIYLESIEYEQMSNVFCLCAVPSVEHSIKCLENIQSYYILHVFYCLIFVNLLNEHNVLINVHSKCYVVIFYIIFKNVYLFSSLYLHIHYVYFYIYYMQCKMVMMHYILWECFIWNLTLNFIMVLFIK